MWCPSSEPGGNIAESFPTGEGRDMVVGEVVALGIILVS